MPRKTPTDIGSPDDLGSSAPIVRDLHSTSDIRFVMRDLGALTTKVDRLIEDVSAQGKKIDGISHQIAFVKGTLWTIGAFVAVITPTITGLVVWLLTHGVQH